MEMFTSFSELTRHTVKKICFVQLGNGYFIQAPKTELHKLYKAMKKDRRPFCGVIQILDNTARIIFTGKE